ncbi:TonB-dependent receptor [Sphingobium yanoikuyae]|uniref:TonB-dependent receptor n=1 Tax=Sphingobium yanoikuyae TaxID=13690 RepID=A0AA42WR21_SPHYA|nr:TonB-dependent receptor [Sphingobium yanoikuyae]MDH2130220.1 TonB-dependent receptor [Sphingobium yanoikuyae]MDH2148035.1 TonB-dependent receptor [Sphingobium yanoikuyae]MDH2165631.1 TonB-dependent receptor [Sphingobium yanoikuyae]
MIEHYSRIASARRSSVIALAVAMMAGAPALAQDQAPQAQPDQENADIVVTGFRASLNSALSMKRQEAAAIDSIVAEDIGKFPDSNLAESMQRVPGIALQRGDGGEGRNISVRGLGPAFTRTRINGMEGTSQTGSSDIYGAGNNGRSFDFNVFPTEIFSALSVRKTPSADVEEGSLGATVDLSAPKPMEQKEDFVLSMTARGVYNELSKEVDPRASLLVSKKFGDSGFGILGSVAYQKRHIREVGYSAVDILSANTNGGFCSPVGFAPQNPADNAAKGADALNCSTGNPRTSTGAAYQSIYDLRRDDLPNTPGSGAFLPRIPRYLNSEQNQERIGGSLTLQFNPDDDTDISLDMLYSRFEVTRRDNYIAAISFARSAANNGQPMTSVRDIEFDENGSLVQGVFDGVDVRSEGLVDHFVSTFKQANLNFRRRLNDSLELSGIVGFNRSIWDGKKRLQTFMDAIDTDGFSIDYSKGGTTPTLGFGIDVNDPASFNYAPGRSDGTVLGGFSYQGKPSKNTTDNMTADINLKWTVSDAFSIKGGAQYRRSNFLSTFLRPYTADTVVRALPAGTTLADITTNITGVDKLWGHGAPSSWAAIDPDKWADTFGFDDVRYCGVECGGGRSRVREEVMSSYLMANFDLSDAIGLGVRGDVGVRYVKTDMLSSGYVTVARASSPTGLTGQFAAATNSYDDWLPSANIVVEPVENVLVRFSGAKVMARPELGLLTPTSGVNPVTRVGNVNNPFLDPIRANTFDVAVEWYFRPGSLLSAAFFYKDIKSFIQNVNSQIPFNQLGLPNALLENSNTSPDELFTVSQPFNTPGGKLKGIELNAQIPFTFLDGFFSNFGVLANYTHVTSKIDYILASVNGVPTVTTTADLVGLSPNTASGTLYYEDDKFSIRTTGNFRDKFIRGIPASPGSDLQGNAKTFYMDASASYNVTDRLKIIVEAQNLTDEQNRLYIDSQRQDTLFETRIGRTFTFGVTYRM